MASGKSFFLKCLFPSFLASTAFSGSIYNNRSFSSFSFSVLLNSFKIDADRCSVNAFLYISMDFSSSPCLLCPLPILQYTLATSSYVALVFLPISMACSQSL
eukprot:Anaeramoba_flamelloidesa84892_429.p3 GENE.a84892_429~~a84892_429.p3  ORF type:complete len:102 (+),score=5.32 a84892_429:667-972(+)